MRSLAVVGLGLIGTSVILAAKRRWPDVHPRGIGRTDSLDGVTGADVVVLATPVDAIIEILPKIQSLIGPGTLVIGKATAIAATMLSVLLTKLLNHAVLSIAAFTFKFPAPVSCTGYGLPSSDIRGAALFTSRDRYCAAVRPGRAALSSAAAPATSGAAKLVPSASFTYPVAP